MRWGGTGGGPGGGVGRDVGRRDTAVIPYVRTHCQMFLWAIHVQYIH